MFSKDLLGKHMFRYFYLLTFLFLSFISFLTKADHTKTWIVSKVYISDTIHTKKVTSDDPMYLYRIFELDGHSIKTNVFSDSNIETCLNYKIKKFKINFDDLLNNNMARNKDEILTAKSFDIEIEQPINQIDIYCPNINETWTLFEKKKNEYLIINTYDSILELKSIEKENVKPSFSCHNAKKLSEKLICQNMYLSGLDKSIHDIYFNIRKDYIYNDSLQEFGEINNRQKEFIRKRDLCTDEKCLIDIMSEYTIELHNDMPLITPY